MSLDMQLSDISILDDVSIKVENESDSYPYENEIVKFTDDSIETIPIGEYITFHIEAKTGYVFNSGVEIFTGSYGDFVFSVGGNEATLKLTPDELKGSDVFNLIFNDISIKEIQGEMMNFSLSSSAWVLNGANVYILSGGEKTQLFLESGGYDVSGSADVVGGIATFSVECKAGWMFDEYPLYTEDYNPDLGRYEKVEFNNINNTNNLQFIQQDYQEDLTSGESWNLENTGFLVAPVEETEDFPYNKVYDMNISQLNELANYSYVERRIQSPFFIEYEILDYARYIVGLFAYPYKIETSEYSEQSILLGDINTNIRTKQITEYLHDINLGNIMVNNNSTDKVGFKNITVELFVPYFDSIILETDEVLGFEISLQLRINVINGKGTLNIYSLRTDSVIYSETRQLGFKIPYYSEETQDLTTSSVLETAFTKPYVQLKVLKPDNEVAIHGTRLIDVDNEYQYLKDDNDINLKTYATEKEQKLIEQHIYNGIFVRKGV